MLLRLAKFDRFNGLKAGSGSLSVAGIRAQIGGVCPLEREKLLDFSRISTVWVQKQLNLSQLSKIVVKELNGAQITEFQ